MQYERVAGNGSNKTCLTIGFGLLVVAAVANVVMTVIFGAHNASKLRNISDDISDLQSGAASAAARTATLEASVSEVADQMGEVSQRINGNDPMVLPRKFSVPYVTPAKDQMNRGTCWDFGTIGSVEQQYREQGVRNGWLKPDEYVQFSEQAYGRSVVDACKAVPGRCTGILDNEQQGSTEGGLPEWLFFFHDLWDKLLPTAVCPYTPNEGNDTTCAGYEEAIATNPIRFTVSNLSYHLTSHDIKRELVRRQSRGLPIIANCPNAIYHVPCHSGSLLENSTLCGIANVVPCPVVGDFGGATHCARIDITAIDLDGEFFDRGDPIEWNAGHVMEVVGYNDECAKAN